MRTLLLFVSFFATFVVRGQVIGSYRYWFDDHVESAVNGIWKGTYFDEAIPIDHLIGWFHVFNLQLRDTTNVWSPVISRSFVLAPTNYAGSKYRYWFDDDIDGLQEGTLTGNLIDINPDVTKLKGWFHVFNLQVSDASETWSPVISRSFVLAPTNHVGSKYRYWFDDDKDGLQEGTLTGNIIDVNPDVNNLKGWFHVFNLQVCDAGEVWSPVIVKPFCVMSSSFQGTGYRYWFDEEGGNAVEGVMTGNVLTLDAIVSLATDGEHTIHLQMHEANDDWSPTLSATFMVSSTGLTIMATGGGTVSYGETVVRDDVANIYVLEGMDVVLTITPDEGFAVEQVMLNGTEDVTEQLEDGEGYGMTLRLKADSLMAVEVAFKLSDLSKLGDVNEDGKVSVSDVVLTADYLLGGTPQPFNLLLADANNDSNVDVADLVEEVRLISDWLLRAPRHAPRQHEVNDVLTAEMQGLSKIALCLQNTAAYTAFQMTLSLPEGMTAEDIQLTEDRRGNLRLVYRKMADGRIRLVAYSMNNTPLNGNEGALIEFVTNGLLQGEAIVEDIIFVTPQGDIHAFAPMSISIADGVVTTKAATLGDGTAYDLAGRKTGLRTKRGIYIINGKKVIWK